MNKTSVSALCNSSIEALPQVLLVVGVMLLLAPGSLSAQSVAAERIQKYQVSVVQGINSSGLDYAPMLTDGGTKLYFVSDRPGGIGEHDIWYATKSTAQGGLFSMPQNLGQPFNTVENEGTVSISQDNKTAYTTRCGDLMYECDIYEVKIDNGIWGSLTRMSVINSTAWESQPFISYDGKSLYFVRNSPSDNVDIFYSTKNNDGFWSNPVQLDAAVNSEQSENSPFLSADGERLFFSSNRSGGYGGFDFYVSEKKPDGSWDTAQNLGPTINTNADERFITMTPEEDIIYFASTRALPANLGSIDIFMATAGASSVDITSRNGEDNLSVYPNPANQFLAVQSHQAHSNARDIEAVLTDIRGTEVLRHSIASSLQTLDVSTLPIGTYILTVGNNRTVVVVAR